MSNHIELSQENHVLKVQQRSLAFYIEELEKGNIMLQSKLAEANEKANKLEEQLREAESKLKQGKQK